MGYPEAVGFTMLGALSSILGALYLEKPITGALKRALRSLRNPHRARPGFNPRLRKALRFYRKYGFWGLMALTPVLIGLPVGVWIAARLGSKRWMIALVCACSCLTWSSLAYVVALNGADWIFG